MKKSLSLILAIAMVFSMFASVAFAAETTTAPKTAQEKFDALKAKGIFEGINEAGDAGLDLDMNRAQAAKILVKLAGLTEDTAAAATFKDLEGDEEWAIGFIGAAKKAGLVEGKADGVFAPADEFTVEELATVLVRFLKLEVSADATVEGEVSDWAKGFVAAAIKAGVIEKSADYTTAASREILVNASFASYEIANKPVQPAIEVKAVGAKKLEVTFNKAVDDKVAEFKVLRGEVPMDVAKKSFNEGKTVATIEMAAPFIKGDYIVEVSGVVEPTFKKTLTLENEKVVKVEFTNDKLAFARDAADASKHDAKTVQSKYKVLNQYNEDIASREGVQFNATKGNATGSNGTLTVTTVSYGASDYILNENVIVSAYHNSTGTFAQQTFQVNPMATVATLEIKGLYNKDGKKPVVGGEDVSKFAIEVEAKDQYGNKVDKAYLDNDLSINNSNNTLFTLATGETAFEVRDDKVVLPLVAVSGSKFTQAGTATVFMFSKYNGKQASVEIKVEESSKVDSLTLTAPAVAVKGEANTEIPYTALDQNGNTLGKAGDKAKLEAVSLNAGSFGLRWEADFVNDKTKLYLDTTAATDVDNAQTIFINGSTPTFKQVTLSMSLQPKAKPTAITGVKDMSLALGVGATTKIEAKNVQVLDQYNRAYKLDSNLASYSLQVVKDKDFVSMDQNVTEGTPAAVNANKSLIETGVTTINVTAAKKGETKFDLVLINKADGKTVASTAKQIRVNVYERADIADLQVAEVAPLYAQTFTGTDADTKYQKDLKVEGKLADGTVVKLPTPTGVRADDFYSVTENTYGLTYAAGKVYANTDGDNTTTSAYRNINAIDAGKEKTFAVVVTGISLKDGASYPKAIEVKVSKVAPAAEAFEYKDGSTFGKKISDGNVKVLATTAATVHGEIAATNSSTTLLSIVNDVVKVKDQYGVEMANQFNVTDVYASGMPTNASDVVAGKSFNVTAVTTNAKVITFKVQIVDATTYAK